MKIRALDLQVCCSQGVLTSYPFSDAPARETDVINVPTPQPVVETMLELADLQEDDVLVSHKFDMSDWQAEGVTKVRGKTVYLWTVPETFVAGFS
jgi:hypothetical protein